MKKYGWLLSVRCQLTPPHRRWLPGLQSKHLVLSALALSDKTTAQPSDHTSCPFLAGREGSNYYCFHFNLQTTAGKSFPLGDWAMQSMFTNMACITINLQMVLKQQQHHLCTHLVHLQISPALYPQLVMFCCGPSLREDVKSSFGLFRGERKKNK